MQVRELKRAVNVERDMDFIRELLLKVEEDREMDGYHYKSFDSSDLRFDGERDALLTGSLHRR